MQPRNITVSFIIPVYNAAAHLERCLRSILVDTSPSLEVIAIDDGSTDESLEILRRFAQEDERVHVIAQANAGSGLARDAGLDEATGAYIMFIDADDYLLPDAMSVITGAISLYQFDMCILGWTTEDPRWRPQPWRQGIVRVNPEQLHDLAPILPALYSAKLVFSLWNKIYSRTFLMSASLRFTNRPISQDADFNRRAFLALPSLLVLPNVVYFYNRHSQSAIHRPNPDKDAWQVQAFDEWESLFEQTGANLAPIKHNDLVFGLISLIEMAGNPRFIPELRAAFLESGFRRRFSRISVRDAHGPRDVIAWLILKAYFLFHRT